MNKLKSNREECQKKLFNVTENKYSTVVKNVVSRKNKFC